MCLYIIGKHWGSFFSHCSTLDQYNAAASTMHLPCLNLSWDDVVKYAFLADFDLLHESHQDICDHPWTKPAYHIVIDQFFKIECAHEEIQHLNIEIPHVITYIQDEDMFFQLKEDKIRQVNPGLARQVGKYRMEKARFNDQHMCRFWKLSLLPGFTSSIKPGISIESDRQVDIPMEVDSQDDDGCCKDGNGEDGKNDSDGENDFDEQRDEEIHAMVSALIALTIDG